MCTQVFFTVVSISNVTGRVMIYVIHYNELHKGLLPLRSTGFMFSEFEMQETVDLVGCIDGHRHLTGTETSKNC